MGDTEPSFYITTFGPLVMTKAGREASRVHRISPLIDGSIRREPDLLHSHPAISCLCRAGKFAPRLRVGDVVAYVTVKRKYGRKKPHRRLVAVLHVRHVLPSHLAGAEWYRENGHSLPSNCMVSGNPCKPLCESHRLVRATGCFTDARLLKKWDGEYRARARAHKVFVVCEPLFRNVSWNAPELKDSALKSVFGKVPGTQNPGRQSMDDFRRLMSKMDIRVPRSVR